MDRPVVVIVDCCHKSPSSISADSQRLLQDILGDQHSKAAPVKTAFSSDTVDIYPMQLETKYYTSDVGLCVVQSPTIGSQEFAEAVESVILFLSDVADLEKDSFASFVDPWLSFIQHWEETAVKILACKTAPSGSGRRLSMQQWCIKNDFELVELDPDEEAAMEANDCGEVTGVRRILQALRAHSWSNLVMKDERAMDADRAERLRSYLQEKDQEVSPEAEPDESISSLSSALRQASVSDSSKPASASSNTQSSTQSASKLHSDVDNLLRSDDHNALLRMANADAPGENPDCGDVSFEELFAKFAEMKEMAASLPPDQRKAYAEKVTVAFWKAIGGDESELGDLEDSDDDDEGKNVSENK